MWEGRLARVSCTTPYEMSNEVHATIEQASAIHKKVWSTEGLWLGNQTRRFQSVKPLVQQLTVGRILLLM